MCSLASAAVGFRTLQAIHDLREVARSGTPETIGRIAVGASLADARSVLHKLIHEDGCRIEHGDAAALHSTLLLAATLPDDDFAAFEVATAVLLADRLQCGLGHDDLFWHWDAFQGQYGLSVPPVRAAIHQGFLRAHENGLVELFDPPAGDGLATDPLGRVIDDLGPLLAMTGPSKPLAQDPAERDAVRIAQLLTDCLSDGGEIAGLSKCWETQAERILGMRDDLRPRLVRGLRHIYETRPAWSPFAGEMFDPQAALVPALPVL